MAKPRTQDDVDTVAICLKCGKIALKGGPIVPDRSFAERLEQCAFGPGWSWCATPPTQYRAGCDPA